VAAAAIIVTALIAVGGWLVSQAQARRATRRNMRIDYLLQAYRRLERASNRPLTPDFAAELEAAIGDVMLLGSPEQAALAADFARKFAAERVADTQPLLLNLRDSLRDELLLGSLPPSAYVSLRVGPGGDTASDTARVWREALESTQRSIALDQQFRGTKFNMWAVLNGSTSPGGAVTTSAMRVESLLRKLLEGRTAEDIRDLPMAQLASRALQLGLIDTRLADSINGLSVMQALAEVDQDRLTEQRAAEFTSIANVVEYLLDLALRAAEPPGGE
jgi:hypothetical protein